MPAIDLVFDGIDRPVRLVDCDDLLGPLRTVLVDWPFARTAAGGTAPIIEVERGDGYRIRAPWLPRPTCHNDPLDTVCGLVAELAIARVHEQPRYLSLHGAAVSWRDKLAFFPCSHRVGKSTLVAALAARGAQVFADDVVIIDSHTGMALANGIAPRVRLPLPPLRNRASAAFIRRHVRLYNYRYAYLGLDSDQRLAYGSRAPVRALVLLQREPTATTSLLSCSPARMLEQLIRQNFASASPARQTLAILRQLVSHETNFVLNYADCSDAADLLLDSLDRLPAAAPTLPAATPLYRGAAVTETCIDGEVFLVNSDNNTIYKLEPLAAAVWRLLAKEAASISEIVALIAAAFPDVPAARIEADVQDLLADLLQRQLVTIKPSPAAVSHSSPGHARTDAPAGDMI